MEGQVRICTNGQHIRVKQICASCVNKFIDGNGDRKCMLRPNIEKVEPDGYCEDWHMARAFRKVGRLNRNTRQLRDLTERIIAFREECMQREEMEKKIKYEERRKQIKRMKQTIKSRRSYKVYSATIIHNS